jgi:TrmH family RNA methyltransferase
MISSTQNPRIKNVLKLDKARERRLQGVFLIEGMRELAMALAGGFTVRELFICRELVDREGEAVLRKAGISPEEISLSVFNKLAYRGQSGGIIAVAEQRLLSPEALHLSETPFIIVLESVEKPGNLGAVLRTADAAAVDAVIVCDPLTDIYNPNVVRSSIGCVFTRQIAVCTSDEACQWMKNKNIRIMAAELTASQWYHQTDYTEQTAVVFGTEADGLSRFWLENADCRIKIPMRGDIDSLNVSVSTAVITFEAMRQRGFNGK